MALIPLKQTVTVKRPGEPDEWGEGMSTEFTMNCRFQEGAKLTRKTSASTNPAAVTSEEVIGVGSFIFDKFADIRMSDELLYTDESGVERTFLPLNVERVRGLNGKAMLTKVTV